MEWYYAESGQQRGPIGQDTLDSLAAQGVIRPDTLVWHDGLADWTAYGDVTGVRKPPPVTVVGRSPFESERWTPAGHHVCVECGKTFDEGEMIRYADSWVCAPCKPIFFQRIREGADTPGTFRYGGFWIRFGAKIVDGIIFMIVSVIGLIGLFVIGFAAGTTGSFPEDPNDEAFAAAMAAGYAVFYLFSFGFQIAYNSWFVGRFGATPGKMSFGLKVVRPDGTRVTYMRAFGRAWAEILNGFTFYIGYMIAGFDSEKRALHDHICDTRVVLGKR